MVEPFKHKPIASSPLRLYPPRIVQPLRIPILGIREPGRDIFTSQPRNTPPENKHEAGKDKTDAKAQSSTLNELQKKHAAHQGILSHLPKKAFSHQNPKTSEKTDSKPETPTATSTPEEPDVQEITDMLMRMPASEFFALLDKHSSPVPSIASHDSFVRVGSKAASSNGDSHGIRSLPESMPNSPWLSLPGSPLLSRVASRMMLTLPALDHSHHAESLEEADSDEEKPVQQSTATIKPHRHGLPQREEKP